MSSCLGARGRAVVDDDEPLGWRPGERERERLR